MSPHTTIAYNLKSMFSFTGHGAVEDMLDAENKLLADNLANKVSRLKSVCGGHNDVRQCILAMLLPSKPAHVCQGLTIMQNVEDI